MSMFWIGNQGEDLDFAYGSISAFASRRTNQEAILGAEESIKEIKYVLWFKGQGGICVICVV